jgi:DNA-binding transcriptional MerR regulator
VYTVKYLSRIAGVTVRTLHHYDQIGLLRPTEVGGNRYRYYGDEALYRLQQVLFYRELGLPLKEIKHIMGRRDFDVLSALQTHRSALQAQAGRLDRLISTIDKTIDHLKAKVTMNPHSLFDGFSEEEQVKYAKEAAQTWDAETVRASNRKWKSYSTAEQQRILAEGKTLYADLTAHASNPPNSKEVQAIVARWHAHLQHFWSPSDSQLLGLADLYNGDSRFLAKYEQIAPGLADFMREAVKVYVKRRNA